MDEAAAGGQPCARHCAYVLSPLLAGRCWYQDRIIWQPQWCGQVRVQFPRLEAAQTNDVPETAADVAAEFVAPIRRVGHPALGEVRQNGVAFSSGHIPQPHRPILAAAGQQPQSALSATKTPDRAGVGRGSPESPLLAVPQPRSGPPPPPLASSWPSALSATHRIAPVSPGRGSPVIARCWPSHSRTGPSPPPLASSRPSALSPTPVTAPVLGPVQGQPVAARCWPSHSRTVHPHRRWPAAGRRH